jgi:hypothetical protein
MLDGIFVKKLKSASDPTAIMAGTRTKDEEGQQKYAAPQPCHADQGAHHKADHDLQCEIHRVPV